MNFLNKIYNFFTVIDIRKKIKKYCFIILFFFFLDANATITVLNYYRMGETDPGAIAGNLCNTSTTDSVGGKNLKKGNNPSYSSGIAAPILGGSPSVLSIALTGSPQDFFSLNTTISDVTTNFVLEAFVKSFDTTSSARLVYNGSQFTAVNGFGFMNINGVFKAAIGTGGNSLTTFGAASVTTDWVHLALVRDNTTATFYVNGVANASSTVTPTIPTGSFLIGSTGRVSGIDEVRFSTFSAGAFQTSDLLYQSVPEPYYTYIILSIGILLIFRDKRLSGLLKIFLGSLPLGKKFWGVLLKSRHCSKGFLKKRERNAVAPL